MKPRRWIDEKGNWRMTYVNQESDRDPPTEGVLSATSSGSVVTASDDALNRSRFLASMGHTLRGPLNSILGFADMLLEGMAGPLTDRQREFVEQIAGAGERQLEIIDNLVTLARLHAGEAPYHPQPVDVHQIIDRAATRFQDRAEKASISLLLDVDPDLGKVFVDPDGVERALGNLLSNALRHMEPGGVVRVAAGVQDPKGPATDIPPQMVSIYVADTGEGIDLAQQETLFEDLEHSATHETRRQQRLGTGLPLTRRLVEREGGSISIQSSGKKGEGTWLRILLPLFNGSTEIIQDAGASADGLPPTMERGP